MFNLLTLYSVAQNALAVFTPTIIRSFGYSPETSQLLSVGPYVRFARCWLTTEALTDTGRCVCRVNFGWLGLRQV